MGIFTKYSELLDHIDTVKYLGKVERVVGLTIESDGPQTEIGELCLIKISPNKNILAEVVGFKNKTVILMPFQNIEGIHHFLYLIILAAHFPHFHP